MLIRGNWCGAQAWSSWGVWSAGVGNRAGTKEDDFTVVQNGVLVELRGASATDPGESVDSGEKNRSDLPPEGFIASWSIGTGGEFARELGKGAGAHGGAGVGSWRCAHKYGEGELVQNNGVEFTGGAGARSWCGGVGKGGVGSELARGVGVGNLRGPGAEVAGRGRHK